MRKGEGGQGGAERPSRDVSGAHGPERPFFPLQGPAGQAMQRAPGPYPPLGAAAPQARGQDEAARGGSRRRTSRRQGGARARARAGAGPAGPGPGPPPRGSLEARGKLQPARGGRRELLPGGFMAHSSGAPLAMTGQSAGLGCGEAAGGAGHAGSARMVRPRAGVRAQGSGTRDEAVPPALLVSQARAEPPLKSLGGSQWLRQLGTSPDAPPSPRRARPLRRLRGLPPGLRMRSRGSERRARTAGLLPALGGAPSERGFGS